MSVVAVVDYGMGNLRSVAKAIEHVADGERVVVTSDAAEVAKADRVVVPGQGAMPDCMRQLSACGLREAVVAAAATKPFLGICIGLQMLFEHSEEGDTPGLGILPGRVRRFAADVTVARGLKVPHMGWNEVTQAGAHPLWQGIADGARYYFVHSYFVEPAQSSVIAGSTTYGIPFTSAVARANIFAVQFHPEKSAQAGLQLLGNFLRWRP
jgi:imidazole glycerol-phosphate synthase subunit HisH